MSNQWGQYYTGTAKTTINLTGLDKKNFNGIIDDITEMFGALGNDAANDHWCKMGRAA